MITIDAASLTPAHLRAVGVDPATPRQTRERSRPGARTLTSVDFATLRDGHRLHSPFKLDFAVRGRALAPDGKPLPGTGHDPVLIDTRLPMGVSGSIPFSDSHRHFSQGQTSAVLDLAPGEHRLRLRLRFVDSLTERDLMAPVEHSLPVVGQERM